MDETNFNWDDLRLFLTVARSGGLAAAEQLSGKSAPTLGRRMLALERQLGQELFKRRARGYELTAEGIALVNAAEAIESTVSPLLVAANDTAPRRVKISAGTWTCYYLSKSIQGLKGNDSIILQFVADEQFLDIAHREVSIGIRNQRPTQVNLAGQRINKVRFAVYAKQKNTKTWVVGLYNTPSTAWIRNTLGDSQVIEVSHPRNALDMVLAGAGKTVLPTFIGDNTKGVKRISEEIEELEHSQWLVTHHEDRHLPEVRATINRLLSVLGTNP